MLGALLVFSACASPDDPAGLALKMPDAALEFLAPDTVRSVDLHPGVAYRYVWSPTGPWAIHLLQADLATTCDLEMGVLQAEVREHGGTGRETVSGMVGRSGERVLGAVNADFFTPEGRTVGTEVVDGQVRFAASRPTFAWRPGAPPWMGIAAIEPAGLRLGWTVDAARGDGATEAVGGFPDLIDAGRRVGDLEVGDRPTFAVVRHPRSGVGYDSRTGQLWMVVVDGRQMPYSAGMSLPEFASLFEALGADEALNLDGGGSSALVVGSRPVNRPSDATGERAVVNALALLQNPRGCVVSQ
jgi:phosphodiester glycosidase